MDIHTGSDTFHIDGFCRRSIRRCFHAQDQYKGCHQHKHFTDPYMFSFFTLFHSFFLLSACFFSFPFFACETLHRKAILVFSSYHISKPRTIKKAAAAYLSIHCSSRFNPNTLQLKQPYTLDRYSPVLVSILILSPRSTNSGTFTLAPVSTVAGFVAP